MSVFWDHLPNRILVMTSFLGEPNMRQHLFPEASPDWGLLTDGGKKQGRREERVEEDLLVNSSTHQGTSLETQISGALLHAWCCSQGSHRLFQDCSLSLCLSDLFSELRDLGLRDIHQQAKQAGTGNSVRWFSWEASRNSSASRKGAAP